MSGMPERSKLSGWLNFAASCRVVSEVIQGGVRCGLGDERAVGAVVVQAARREAARLEVGLRARTPNISFMLVTLDVSNFSSQLNFFAFCRVVREVIQGGGRCGLRRQGGGRLRCVSGMQAREGHAP